jgi:hypothetical protein
VAWLVTTATGVSGGSSSMAASTGLVRTVSTLAGAHVLTSFDVGYQIALGVGAGSYSTFAAGQIALFAQWQVGVSWVPTGGTVPNLFTNQDDSQFLWVEFPVPLFDRNTINTAGAPAYKDEFTWGGRFRGRMQIPFPNGGTINWHVANIGSATTFTGWSAAIRCSYV